MAQFNSALGIRRCGARRSRAVLLGMLALPCSLHAMMDSNTAAAGRAGSGPDIPLPLCGALIAPATDSVATHPRRMAGATRPPLRLLTDIAWLAAHHCPFTRCRWRRI